LCIGDAARAAEVVAAVNGRAEVLIDGGIRRGGDIVKALCLGARRADRPRVCIWTAARPPGVDRAIEFCKRICTERCGYWLLIVKALDSSYVYPPRKDCDARFYLCAARKE